MMITSIRIRPTISGVHASWNFQKNKFVYMYNVYNNNLYDILIEDYSTGHRVQDGVMSDIINKIYGKLTR